MLYGWDVAGSRGLGCSGGDQEQPVLEIPNVIVIIIITTTEQHNEIKISCYSSSTSGGLNKIASGTCEHQRQPYV